MLTKTPVICNVCGREVRRRRDYQLYCSAKCRLTSFREKIAARALRSVSEGEDTEKRFRPASKPPQNQGVARCQKRDRPPVFSVPLNLLGGHRWPDAKPLAPALHRAIVSAEIGDSGLHSGGES